MLMIRTWSHTQWACCVPAPTSRSWSSSSLASALPAEERRRHLTGHRSTSHGRRAGSRRYVRVISPLRVSLCWKPRTVGQRLESDMVDGGHISRFSRSSVSSDLRSADLACPRFFALNCSAFCYAQATSSAVRPTTRTNSLMQPMHRTKRALLLVGDADANSPFIIVSAHEQTSFLVKLWLVG